MDGNALDGVLVRSDAYVQMDGCRVHDNGGHGVSLQDAGGRLEGNEVYENKKGAVLVQSNSFDLGIDIDAMQARNSIKGQVLVQ